MNHDENLTNEDGSLVSSEADDNGNHDEQHDRDSSTKGPKLESVARDSSRPRLSSRVLVTWLELTVTGIIGGLLGATVGGAPGFIIYLTMTLLAVGIILYNVNELIKEWMRIMVEDI